MHDSSQELRRPRTGSIVAGVLTLLLALYAGSAAVSAPDGPDGEPILVPGRTQPMGTRFPARGDEASFFIENRGQVSTLEGQPAPDVRAVLYSGGMRVFVRSTGLSFVQTVREVGPEAGDDRGPAFEEHEEHVYSIERSDAEFLGANPHPRLRLEDEMNWYANFYTSAKPDGETHLRPARRAVLEEIWPGIDAVLRIDGGGLKYDFVVKPYANMQDIRIRYSDNVAPRLRGDGGLELRTTLGMLQEDPPRCWFESGGARHETRGRFVLEGRTLRFDVQGALPGATLVIDPSLSWSTYVGSSGNDYAGTVDVDVNDDVWVCGGTTGSSFPTTPGVFQSTKIGTNATDGFVIKFSSAGARLWATYYRGASLSTGLRCEPNGNAFYTGATNDPNFPVSAGAFQGTLSSGYDAFLIKMRGDGTRAWATFFGGSGNDAGIGLTVDGAQTIYFTGQTSSSNFPVTGSAFQTAYGGGTYDAFLARFDTTGARAWSTYIGSSSSQWGHGCTIDSSGNVIVVGTTGSGFPTTAGTAYPNYPTGSNNNSGFVIKFSDQGNRIWGTYFGTNTTAYDLICVGGDPIFVGWTTGSIPTTPGAFQGTRPGQEDGFLARLNSTGSMVVWATYLGGSQLDHVTSIRVGASARLHVTGCTYSGNFPVTTGAYQTVFAGIEDRFVAQFNANGQRCWASFIGGTQQDWCWHAVMGERPEHSIAVGSSGEFYAVGITMGAFPTTPGSFRPTSNGGDESFLMRFVHDCVGVVTARAGNDTTICKGSHANIGLAGIGSPCAMPLTYSWSPSIGLNRTDTSRVIASPTSSTTYTVTVTDADGCFGIDSVRVTVTDLGAAINPNPATMCPGTSRMLQATTGTGFNYKWFFNGSAISGATSSTYTATQPGDYRVLITMASGCYDTSAVLTVTVTPGPGANITVSGPTSFCIGGNVTLQANTGANYTYMWQRNGTTISGANSSSYVATQAGNYRVIVTNTNSCSDTSSAVTVSILPGPGANITPAGPTTFCEGGSVLLNANTGAGYTYEWLRDGLSIPGAASPSYRATQAGSYRVIVTGSNGCPDTSTAVIVTVIARPGATLNATPTSFCEGDRSMLTANSGAALTYLWQRNGMTITGAGGSTYAASQSGSYRVIVSNAGGCADTSNTVTLTVFPRPVASATAGGPVSFCEPDSVLLTGEPATGVTYEWLRNDTLISGETGRAYRAGRSGSYSVVVTDGNGCKDTSAAIRVTAYARPGAWITGGPPIFCEDQSAVLSANTGSGFTYVWQKNLTTIPGATSLNLVVWQTGRYRVIVTGPGSCTDTSDEFLITVIPKPKVTLAAAGPTVLCEPGIVILNASTTSTANFEWLMDNSPIPGAGSASYTAKESGSYRVVITDANGCTDTSGAILVRINPLPHAAIDPPGPAGFCTGSNLLLNAPAGSGFKYAWQRDGTTIGGATAQTYLASQPGSYRVIITTSEGCTDTSAYTNVTVNPLPDQRIEGKTSVCPNSIATYFITNAAGFEFEWSVANGMLLSGRTTPKIEVRWVAAGTGQVRVRIVNSATGCARDTMLTVSITTSLRPIITSNGPGVLCEGDSVLLDGGAGYASYEWFKDGSPLNARTRNLSVRSAGVYTVAVNDSGGCNGISEPYIVTLNPKPLVLIAAGGPTALCDGEQVLLSASATPDAAFTWYRDGGEILGETGNSFTARQPGRYRVRGTTKAGCSALSDEVTVIVNAAPRAEAFATGPTTLCAGDSVTLHAKPETGVTYQWLRDGAPVSGGDRGQLSSRQAGAYSVIVRDIAAGCTDTSEAVLVAVRPAPIVLILGDTTFCEGAGGVLRAGGSGGSYRWSNGESGSSITVSSSGRVELTVTDSGGCTAVASVEVRVHPSPAVSIQGSRTMCKGGQTTLDARPGFVSYIWSTGSMSQRVTVTVPGTYWVEVKDGNGCSARDTAIVIESDRLTPAISGKTVLCPGSVVDLEADSNESYIRYIWTTESDTVTHLGSQRRFSVTAAGRYMVRVIDRGGCAGYAVTEVIAAQGGARITGRLSVCVGMSPDTLDAGIGFASYLWNTGARDRYLVVTQPGVYSVQATDSNGCVWNASETVREILVQPVIAGQKTFCSGGSARLSAVYAGARDYLWSTGARTRDVVIADSGAVWVRVTDSSGCEGTTYDTLRIADALVPLIAGPRAFCPGDSVTLDAGPGLAWCLWSGTDTSVVLASGRLFTTGRAGSYIARIADSSGCEGMDSVRIIAHAVTPPLLLQSGDTLDCEPRSTYQWLREGIPIPGAVSRRYVAPDSGSYACAVTDANGCSSVSEPVRITRGATVAALSLSCPPARVYPVGAEAIVRVMLDGVTNLRPGGAGAFTAFVSSDPKILFPVFPATADPPAAREVPLRVRGRRDASMTQGALLELPFRVLWGDTACARVRLDSLVWDDGTVTSLGGAVCELCADLCYEGGARLFLSNGQVLLRAHPNPFNATTLIEFEVIEEGASELAVFDMMGRRVVTLASGTTPPGRYMLPFDASSIASGTYICVLLTPTEHRTLLLEVLK